MQYCNTCNTVEDNKNGVCSHCGAPLKEAQAEDWVLLATDKEFEINTLCAAFSDQDIPFKENLPKRSITTLQGRGFQGQTDLFVQYEDLPKAKALARKLGFSFPDDVQVTPLDAEAAAALAQGSKGKSAAPKQSSPASTAGSAGQKTKAKEKAEEGDTKKKKLGRLLFFASVLVAVVLVVFLSDWIIGGIKGLL